MPFCSYCGSQIGDSSRFCPQCGKSLLEHRFDSEQTEKIDVDEKNHNKQIVEPIPQADSNPIKKPLFDFSLKNNISGIITLIILVFVACWKYEDILYYLDLRPPNCSNTKVQELLDSMVKEKWAELASKLDIDILDPYSQVYNKQNKKYYCSCKIVLSNNQMTRKITADYTTDVITNTSQNERAISVHLSFPNQDEYLPLLGLLLPENSDFDLGIYSNPIGDGAYIFEANHTGIAEGGGDAIDFTWNQNGNTIYINEGNNNYELKIINKTTLKLNEYYLYLNGIER